MKNVLIIIGLCISIAIGAQESVKDSVSAPETSKLENDTIKHEVTGDNPTIEKQGDTTRIRLGKRGITIVEKDGKTTVNIDSKDEEKDNKDEASKDDDDNHGWDVPEVPDFPGHDSWKKNKENKFRPHYAGVDLFFNNYVNADRSMKLSKQDDYMTLNFAKSMGVNVNIFEYGIPFSKLNGLVTGLGMEFNSYYFKGNNNIQIDTMGVIVNKPFTSNGGSYQKTKFRDTYITVPLLYEMQFERNTKRPFYISFGVIGGIKIGSSTKELYTSGDSEIEHIVSGGININQLRYGYHVKIGFRYLNLFATYYPTPLYEKDKGPELYPFNVGLTLVSF
jgi:hypothetical protein